MASEVDGAKSKEETELSLNIYSVLLKNSSNIPGSLAISKDGQICLLTRNGAHILLANFPTWALALDIFFPCCNSFSEVSRTASLLQNLLNHHQRQKSAANQMSALLKFSLMLLPTPSKEDAFDVEINPDQFCLQPTVFPQSYTFALDRTLNPNKANLARTLFIESSWSPPNILKDGSCILATLSANNRVYISKDDTYTGISKILLELTKTLYDNFKNKDFIDPNIQIDNLEEENASNISIEFRKYKERQYYLAITGIDWCPQIFENVQTEKIQITNCVEDTVETYASTFLCGCNKLGMIIIWLVNVNMINCQITTKVLGSVPVSKEFATTVAWYQEASSSRGCIAVAFSNGFIRLCVIEIKTTEKEISFKKLQIYDLWMEDDMMHVKFIKWLKKGNDAYLVATKDSNVILFRIEFDENQLVSSHSYTFAPCKHDQPISALCCKDELVVTTSIDARTECFHIGDDECKVIKDNCSAGYGCFGMQISSDGLLILQMICPSSIIFTLGKKIKELELVVSPFVSFETAANSILDSQTSPSLEMYEHCRCLASNVEIPKILEDFAATSFDETMSIAQLQKKQFVDWLIKKTKGDSAANTESQEPDFKLVLQRRVQKTLNDAIRFIESGDGLDNKSRKLTLLAADWLIIRGNKDQELMLATSIYKLLAEFDSIQQAKLLWEKKMQEMNRTAAVDHPKNTFSDFLMPSRESCPVCKRKVLLENCQFGSCEKGHRWTRCCLTLLILHDMKNRTCNYCGRQASCKENRHFQSASIYRQLVNVNNCSLCNGRLLES